MRKSKRTEKKKTLSNISIPFNERNDAIKIVEDYS